MASHSLMLGVAENERLCWVAVSEAYAQRGQEMDRLTTCVEAVPFASPRENPMCAKRLPILRRDHLAELERERDLLDARASAL